MNKIPLVTIKLAVASLLIHPVLAQESGSGSAEDDDIFELSPFTIDASKDTGYRAKDSLSGSRLKVNLDDLSVPIDVITPEVMDDFNITQQEDLFDIVSNMEQRDDSFLSGVYESGASYRIRGFVGVKSLRNFVGSNMTFDRYNSTRFIASKGPNSILFGAGPGGGSVSFFTKRYMLGSKDRTRIGVTVDSFGTVRSELSGTKTLLDDRWGIQYSAFDETRKYEIKPSYESRNGLYLSSTFRAFENTVITGSYESRSESVFRPASHYGTLTDYYTQWDELGSPAVLGTGVGNRNSDLELADGSIEEGQAWRSWGMEQYGTAQRLTLIDGQMIDLAGSARTDRTRDTAETDGQRNFRATEWNRYLGPTGLNGGAEVLAEAYDLNVEQKITDDLYLMLAWGKTDSNRDQYQHRLRQLYKDPNAYMPDGSTNPHFGEFYTEHSNYNFFDKSNESEALTATLAYQLDLEENNKFLGKHNFALMHSNEEVTNMNVRQSMIMTGSADPAFDYADVDVDLAQYKMNFRTYLGDDLDTLTSDDMFEDYRYIRRTGKFEQDGYTFELHDGVGSTGASTIDNTSQMFVAQSSFLRSRLITSFGYREEEVDQYIVNFAKNPGMRDQYTAYEHYTKEQAEDPTYTKVLTDDIRPANYPTIPWQTVNGISRNLGGVFKITPNIALVGNVASNLTGSANRTGIFGQPLQGSEGESEDYGIRFNLFDNKLRVEYTRYNTATTNQAYQSSRLKVPNGDASNIWTMMIQNGSGARDVFENGLGWDLRDFRSRGHELTLSGSPIDGMSLRVAASYNEQVATNLGSTFMNWWNAGNGDAIRAFAAANPDAFNLESTSSEPETAAESMEDIEQSLSDRLGIEGIPNVNQPLWAVKGLAKYSFREGKLKGHETGLNIAWRSKKKSNFFRNADGSYDYDRPFWSTATTNTNLFWNFSKKLNVINRDVTWKLQFNIDNLFNTETLTDRNFFYGIRGDETSPLLSNSVDIRPGRKISMTNSFSF